MLVGVVLCGRAQAQDASATRSDLLGVVVDARGTPIAGVQVTIGPTSGGIHPPVAFADERVSPESRTTDASGGFTFAQLANGAWQLSAHAPDGRGTELALALPRWPAGARVVVPLPDTSWRSPRVAVRVLTPDGEPVADATVGLHVQGDDAAIVAHDTAPALALRSDAGGHGAFADVPQAPLVLVATTGDGRVGVLLEVGRRSEPEHHATVLVEPPGGIDATLDGIAASELDGSHLRALLVTNAESADASCHGLVWTARVRDGRAAFRGLPVGRYALALESPRGLCLDLPRTENVNLGAPVVPWTVAVAANNVADTRMRVVPGGALVGRVTDASGAPIAGASVVATFATAQQLRARRAIHLDTQVRRLDDRSIGAAHPSGSATTVTDANGACMFAGLPPGLLQVEIAARDHTFALHRDVAIAAGRTARLDERLAPAGVLQGVCPTEAYIHLAAIAVGSRRPTLLAILPNPPTFTFAGLAPGEWQLATWRYDRDELTPITTVQVVAGRTTWIDLRGKPGARITGRLRDPNGKALAGVVELRSQLVPLQRDGSFAFDLHQPLDTWPEAPRLDVQTENGRFTRPLPPGALGAAAWHGDFESGGCELAIALQDAEGRAMAGTAWLLGPVSRTLEVPIGGITLRGLAAGSYRLGATAAEALVETQQFDLQKTTSITLVGTPAAHVDVRVLDRAGRIVPGRHVVLRSPTTGWRTLLRTDEDGVAHGLVPPGPVLATFELWEGQVTVPVEANAAIGAPQRVTLRLSWR